MIKKCELFLIRRIECQAFHFKPLAKNASFSNEKNGMN